MAESQGTGFGNAARNTSCRNIREPPEIAAGEPSHHPVVIVGGGITGLTAACALAQYGIRPCCWTRQHRRRQGRILARHLLRRSRWRSSSAWACTSASPPRASSGAWAAPSPARTRCIPST
nr:NAD(P)-binding protein [Ramlibacter montanisoli]